MECILWFLVHGGLTEWSQWGRCNRLCEHGKQKRYKTCTNPKPRCGGKQCDASLTTEEERPCFYCAGEWCIAKELYFGLPISETHSHNNAARVAPSSTNKLIYMGCGIVVNTTLVGGIGRNCLQTNNKYNSQALYQTLQPTKWMNYEKLLG